MPVSASESTPESKGLNPFALPSETDALFRLLVIAAWMVAIMLSLVLLLALNPEASFDGSFVQTTDPDQRAGFVQEILPSTLSAVATTLVLFGLAYALYRSYPGRIRRRKQLEPLTPDKDQAFYSAVNQIVQQTGLTPAPSLEVGTKLSGLAFDYRPRPAIALDGSPRGLRLQLRKAPDAVQAIVLHEAAHIANQDVERSYFAQALWTVVVPVTVIPLLAWVLVTGLGSMANLAGQGQSALEPLSLILLTAARAAIMLGIVGLVRAQLLRTRELYADARAASWGARRGLLRNLGNAAASEIRSRASAWSLHPLARERIATIEDPRRLFQFSWVIPFVTGFLLALIMTGLVIAYLPATLLVLEQIRWLRLELGPDQHVLWLASRLLWFVMAFVLLIVPVIFVGVLAHGTLGVQLRRQTVSDMVHGATGIRRYLHLLGPAILVTLGIEVGFIAITFSPLAADNWREVEVAVPWMLIAGTAIWFWLASYRYLILNTYKTRVGENLAKTSDRSLALVSTVLLVVLFLPTILASRLFFDNGQELANGIAFGAAVLLLSIAAYGAFFLVAWLVFQVRSASGSPRCPACGTATKYKVPIAESCETCHAPLAPWLVTTQPS
jgi:Zn-dependent protease with chaperone function